MNNEQMFSIEFTLEELNKILRGLVELPHKDVDSLIRKIVQEGNQQVEQNKPEKPAE